MLHSPCPGPLTACQYVHSRLALLLYSMMLEEVGDRVTTLLEAGAAHPRCYAHAIEATRGTYNMFTGNMVVNTHPRWQYMPVQRQ